MNAASLHSERLLQGLQAREQDETAQLLLRPGGNTQGIQNHCSSGRILARGPYGASPPPAEAYPDGMPARMDGLKQEHADDRHDPGSAIQPYHTATAAQADLLPTRGKRPLIFTGSSVGDPGEDGARQIAILQGKLAQRLGPEYIATKPGPAGAGKIPYLEGFKAIDLANEVFGFNGWSSTIVRLDIDFLDELEGRRLSVGVSAIVRVTLRDGTFHEDCGYGNVENMKSKAQALEKAKKEAVTDAIKRALRTFGRLLGNCLYDKKFTEAAMKFKADPPKYEAGALKRGPEANYKHQSTHVQQQTTHGYHTDQAHAKYEAAHQARACDERPNSATNHPPAPVQGHRAHVASLPGEAPHRQAMQGKQVSPINSSAARLSRSPSTAKVRTVEGISGPDEQKAREMRRAQAAQRQAELREKHLIGSHGEAQKSKVQEHTESSSKHAQPTAKPANTVLHLVAMNTAEVDLGDINFSQCSDIGGDEVGKESIGDDTSATLVEPTPPQKRLRPGRFVPSPTSLRTFGQQDRIHQACARHEHSTRSAPTTRSQDMAMMDAAFRHSQESSGPILSGFKRSPHAARPNVAHLDKKPRYAHHAPAKY